MHATTALTTTPPAVIFDIDGTLADITHRLEFKPGRHLNGGPNVVDHKAFMDACTRDRPIWPVIQTARALDKAGHSVHLLTGRMEPWRDETTEWLTHHKVPFASLHMRPTGDARPDFVVKKELYERYLSDQPVMAVFDDRTRVVKMWRGLGLPCFQVAPGDY